MLSKEEIREYEEKLGIPNYTEMMNFPLYVNETLEDDGSYWLEDMMYDVQPYIDIFNSGLQFHTLSVRAGNIDGAQFWVEPHEPNWDEQPKMFPQYYNGRTCEEVWEAVLEERNEIRNWMANWASHYGYEFVSQGIAWKPENIGKMVERPF